MNSANHNPDGKPEAPAAFAPATCYAEWRAMADIRLADLERRYWEHHWAAKRLATEISDLKHVMGNGKAGGTAWTLHNICSEK